MLQATASTTKREKLYTVEIPAHTVRLTEYEILMLQECQNSSRIIEDGEDSVYIY